MLTEETVEKINDQIQDELRDIAFTSSTERQAKSFEKIRQLKALLETPKSEQTIRKEILEELAAAIVEASQKKTAPTSILDLFEDYFIGRRCR